MVGVEVVVVFGWDDCVFLLLVLFLKRKVGGEGYIYLIFDFMLGYLFFDLLFRLFFLVGVGCVDEVVFGWVEVVEEGEGLGLGYFVYEGFFLCGLV